MRVLILSDDDVRRALPADGCERAMATVLAAHARGAAYVPLRSVMAPPGAPGFMGLMPAYATGDEPGGSFAVKSICLMPGNRARGLDMHQGTVTLFSGETGMPVVILNASAVTEIRTAAVTAAATRVLAARTARVLAVLGTGVQGRSHLRALAGVRDWEQVRIYSPSAAHVEAAAEDARARGTAAVHGATSARDAVEGADVVVTATSSRRPVLEHAWLSPGAHVNAVGASTPAAYEIDVATVAAAALFCDSRESLTHEAGEFRRALEQGAIAGPGHVRAELGEVLAGLDPGRSDGELTMFRSLGLGIEDLAAARLALVTAREHGIGTEVEL